MLAPSVSVSKPRTSKKWVGKLIRQTIFYVSLILIWQGFYALKIAPDYFFPGPLEVLDRLHGFLQNGSLITAILVSLRRLILGYGISLVIGVIFGLLIAVITTLKRH